MNKKIIIYFFLYIFCSFIITPAVIKVIEKNADISCFYNMVEEEKKSNTSEIKELKELPYTKEDLLSFSQLLENKENYYYYMHHVYDRVIDVIIPPPEHIS